MLARVCSAKVGLFKRLGLFCVRFTSAFTRCMVSKVGKHRRISPPGGVSVVMVSPPFPACVHTMH